MFRAVACASAAALASAAPQGGNYQQFLDQWAEGYGHLANDSSGAGGGSFDYNQYMSGGQDAQANSSSATALGSSFDYSKYTGGAGGGSSMANSSGYSGYMQKYGDYSRYMGGNGSSGGGDYGNYSRYTGGSPGGGYGNYSEYTGGSPGGGYGNYSKYTNYSKATSMAAAGGGDFVQKYISGADWQRFVPRNTSSSAGGARFNHSGYAPFDYSKYTEQGQQNQTMSATDCHDMSCLKAWRAARMSTVHKSSQLAPEAGQDAWSAQIEDEYETNKNRIQVEENATMHPVQGERNHSIMGERNHSNVTMGERNHSKEAARAKVVEVNATAAARDPLPVGTVTAAPAEDLSASPVEESRGVGPARWVVLGSVMLVAVGVAVRAARARPLSSLPEEDPNQAYLALA